MLYRTLIGLLLLLASGIASAQPSIELTDAMDLAQKYISDRKISNADRYLKSINWREDRVHPEKSCWVVFWAPKDESELHGELVVWVSDVGTVKHQSGAW